MDNMGVVYIYMKTNVVGIVYELLSIDFIENMLPDLVVINNNGIAYVNIFSI